MGVKIPIEGAGVKLNQSVLDSWRLPNFSQPDASIGTLIGATGQFIPGPLFGRITGTGGAFGGGPGGGASSTGGARTIQLALRFAY